MEGGGEDMGEGDGKGAEREEVVEEDLRYLEARVVEMTSALLLTLWRDARSLE